jgi:hypothetical protein
MALDYIMAGRTLAIILAGCVGGVIAISIAMLAGSGWETPGTYTGVSDASHAVTTQGNCQPFQSGCSNTNYGAVSLSGSSSAPATSGAPSSSSGSSSSSSSGGYSP